MLDLMQEVYDVLFPSRSRRLPRIVIGETAGREDDGTQLGHAAATAVVEVHKRKAGPGPAGVAADWGSIPPMSDTIVRRCARHAANGRRFDNLAHEAEAANAA